MAICVLELSLIQCPTLELLPFKLLSKALYHTKIGLLVDNTSPIHHLLYYTPQVDAWHSLQASHLLEWPISLRCNWNHRFLTLEFERANKMRHACVGALSPEGC